MSDPHRRSASVTAAGVVAIVCSALTSFGVLLGTLGLLFSFGLSHRLPSPPFVQVMTFAMMIIFLAISVFGIFAGIGLLRLKNWARIATLVWAGITVPNSAFIILLFVLIPIPTPPGTPPNFVYLFRFFSVLFYGIPLTIAVWWLILFTRKSVAAQFAVQTNESIAGPSEGSSQAGLAGRPRLPLPLAVIAWLFLVTSLCLPLVVLMPAPALLFGFVIRGVPGKALFFAWGLLYAAAGVGLLKLKRWSYSLTAILQALGMANVVISTASPKYDAVMRETISSMSFGSNPPYTAQWMDHFRPFTYVLALVVPVIVLTILSTIALGSMKLPTPLRAVNRKIGKF